MKLTVEEIAGAIKGRVLSGAEAVASGVSTDSRRIRPGDVFFALKGPNFDGHRFVHDVASKGAAVAVVDSAPQGLPASFGVVLVKDTLRALGDLASYARNLNKIPLVAITGSAGKTTTKEMVSSILARSRSILKTTGNMNNLIGMPLTLLGLTGEHGAAVIELGISEPWEMERLVEICRPDIGAITNIGRSHLKSLGSLEGVAMAKGPIFTSISGGTKVVNLDDPWVVKVAGGNGRAVTYSMEKEAGVRVKRHEAAGLDAIDVIYDVRGTEVAVRINSPGVANVMNGAAAIAATLPLGATTADITEGLASFSNVRGRMEVLNVNGLTILDDTYNANPESMSAALKTLMNAKGRKIAVLGDMLELGEASKTEHRTIGRLAGEAGVEIIVAIGEWSKEVADGFTPASKSGAKALDFSDRAEAIEALKGLLREGDNVLVKGSRATALEKVVEGLKAPDLRMNKAV